MLCLQTVTKISADPTFSLVRKLDEYFFNYIPGSLLTEADIVNCHGCLRQILRDTGEFVWIPLNDGESHPCHMSMDSLLLFLHSSKPSPADGLQTGGLILKSECLMLLNFHFLHTEPFESRPHCFHFTVQSHLT